jgi:hypothetical protein
MSSIHEAQLIIVEIIQGVLLDLADFESMDDEQKQEFADQMADVAEIIIEALSFEVTSYDEETGEVAAKLSLASPE